MKPITAFRIAAANVSQKPLRSLSLALIAAVFTFMLFSGSMIAANLQAGIESLSARMGADLLVVPQGEGKKLESVILRAEPSTFYLDGKLLDVVRGLPGVAQASGQLFISSLDAQCCTVKVQLIGIDEATDFVVAPWLRKAAEKPLEGNEVIVGDYIFGDIGSELTFYDRKFRIVGRLAPTGMGFDSSIFMTIDAARDLGKVANPEKAGEIATSVSSILVRVNPGVDPITISDELLDELGLGAGVNFVFASNMMSDTSAKLRQIVGVMYSAAGGFWVVAALIMMIVYFFAFNERQREFATLRALGASRSRVIGIVMREALMISAAGSVAGVAIGAIAVTSFSTAIARAIGLPYLAPEPSSWAFALAAALIAGIATVPLAALPTAWRIGRRDIYPAMRED
ncbi:ABC transporter permease [Sutterella sp.]|uniref:ABC transporter permease n=1 Tax=Sutterella sp. TaxID=1981025 RepID=UPI0026E0B52E|nr:ABC transporter permease [Sutterella sp.]MDO5531375.1 ABC transporter permease [Sutterella sp.]